MQLKLIFSLAAWLTNTSRLVFTAWPNSKQTQSTFIHLTDVLTSSLVGRSPCCSKLFRLWAATTLTLSISWFWILGCNTGSWTVRSSFVEWQQQKTVVILQTSQWRGCRCWKIENITGTKNKKHLIMVLGDLHLLLPVFKLPTQRFRAAFHPPSMAATLGIFWHAPALFDILSIRELPE